MIKYELIFRKFNYLTISFLVAVVSPSVILMIYTPGGIEVMFNSLDEIVVCNTFFPKTSKIIISLSKDVLEVMYILPLLTGFG